MVYWVFPDECGSVEDFEVENRTAGVAFAERKYDEEDIIVEISRHGFGTVDCGSRNDVFFCLLLERTRCTRNGLNAITVEVLPRQRC